MFEFLIMILTTMVIPWFIMRLIVPDLAQRGPKYKNYRGVDVFFGLGVVWALWILGVWTGSFLIDLFHLSKPEWVGVILKSLPLVLGACMFGIFDDFIGAGSKIKGFKGHLSALVHGHVSTGLLKLVGIGVLSVFMAAQITYPFAFEPLTVVVVLLKALTIALCANFINLLDLRPTRAYKGYSCLLGVISLYTLLRLVSSDVFVPQGTLDLILLVVCSLGPLLATWKYDAREVGMMGDAGSNAMGAYLGYLAVVMLPLFVLTLFFVALLILNLISERYSFSAFIERTPFLARFDQWGRN